MERRKGFIFSLDAFIALSVMLASIYAIFSLVSTPKPYYTTFEQSYDLASDTLVVLAETEHRDTGMNVLEFIGSYAGGSTQPRGVMRTYVDHVIPDQYGYRFEFYNRSIDKWKTIYDTADDSGTSHNKEYRKMQASAQTVVTGYKPPAPGEGDENQYGYIRCYGTMTPCEAPVSNFIPGDMYVGIIRLTVYV